MPVYQPPERKGALKSFQDWAVGDPEYAGLDMVAPVAAVGKAAAKATPRIARILGSKKMTKVEKYFTLNNERDALARIAEKKMVSRKLAKETEQKLVEAQKQVSPTNDELMRFNAKRQLDAYKGIDTNTAEYLTRNLEPVIK